MIRRRAYRSLETPQIISGCLLRLNTNRSKHHRTQIPTRDSFRNRRAFGSVTNIQDPLKSLNTETREQLTIVCRLRFQTLCALEESRFWCLVYAFASNFTPMVTECRRAHHIMVGGRGGGALKNGFPIRTSKRPEILKDANAGVFVNGYRFSTPRNLCPSTGNYSAMIPERWRQIDDNLFMSEFHPNMLHPFDWDIRTES